MMTEERYADLFEKYVQAADGKKLIGNALAEIASAYPDAHVLDVGAGSGEITGIVASAAGRVDAVDPNRYMVADLKKLSQRCANVSPIEGRLQDFSPSEHYDLIILSYVLESIGGNDVQEHAKRLHGYLRPGGRMVGVTFLDGCDWDAYSASVESLVPYKRTGGTGRVFNHLRQSGLNTRIIRIVDTHIFAPSLDELYLTLGFFYKRVMDNYIRLSGTLSSELRKFTTKDRGGELCLGVKEVIYEIIPMPSGLFIRVGGSGGRCRAMQAEGAAKGVAAASIPIGKGMEAASIALFGDGCHNHRLRERGGKRGGTRRSHAPARGHPPHPRRLNGLAGGGERRR